MAKTPVATYLKDIKFDRRDFLGMSTSAALGCLISGGLPEKLTAQSNTQRATIALRPAGSKAEGYVVGILFDGMPINASAGGEFSARFQNGERSLEDDCREWRANSWTGDESRIVLAGEAQLTNLNATIFVEVVYEVATPNVVRKTIRLRQSDMYMLFYQLSNRLQARERPARLWSFDQADCQGGTLREYFPSAGFRMGSGVTVGLLTDAGYRNQWSRMYRRDGKPIKPAASRIPDANLLVVCSAEERREGKFYVEQTFGESLHQLPDESAQSINLLGAETWQLSGSAAVKREGETTKITAGNSRGGALIPFSAKAGEIYSVECEYQSDVDAAIAVWGVDENLNRLQDFNHFNDSLPKSSNGWTSFRGTVFVPSLPGKCAVLSYTFPEVERSTGSVLRIRNPKVTRVPTRQEPYHRLEMDLPAVRTSFIFADKTVPDTLRGYRLASQIHLAEALDCKGGKTEKVLYADLMMLCWNAGTESFRPMLAPSIWYSAAGEIYLRDSFFALSGTHNRELNERVFDLWAENQGEDGAINTLVEPEMTNLERKSNDSTPLWLMWALLNRRKFGYSLPMNKIKRAATYCLNTFDAHQTGMCSAKFVMGQLDVIAYPESTSTICQNQGLLAVVLRTIQALEIAGISSSISDERVRRAEEIYRSYYDPSRKFMMPARDITDAIGFAEIFPEYLSLWLFQKKILTDEMVINHLDRIPVMMPRSDAPYPELGGTVRPIFIGLTDKPNGWRFFTEKWHPMVSDSYAKSYANREMDGIYYNGGSWMRIEICGYVAGKLHGWATADKAINNRLWVELHASKDFPTSQEYLAVDPAHPFYGSHRVFAWNAAVLQALELAGMRSPESDPDYTRR